VQDAVSHYALNEPLRWRCIDGEWLAFGMASGALLRPVPLAAAVLALIEEQPLTRDEIVRCIAQDTELAVTPEMAGRVGAVIDELVRAEIMECRQP
jgi:hypothetical protein